MNKNNTIFNNAFEAKLSWKRKEAFQLTSAIEEHFVNFLGIDLVKNNKEVALKLIPSIKYENIVKFYFAVKESGYTLSAVYEQNETIQTVPLMHMYNKSPLDPVWNFRKYQLIRKKIREFLLKTNLHERYVPFHLVFTLPHKNGKVNGKRFYTTDLIKCFHELRRTVAWKDSVYGGEYGVEIKKSTNKNNGLHIHIHSLCFFKKDTDFQKIEKELSQSWNNIVLDYLGIEKASKKTQFFMKELYFFETEEIEVISSQTKQIALDEYETVNKVKKIKKINEVTVTEQMERIKKNQSISKIERKIQTIDTYTKGILECVKYHFKFDTFIKDENKKIDIDLLIEILNNIKNVRLYNRFGAFSGNSKKIKGKKALYHLSFNDLGDENIDKVNEKINKKENLTLREQRLLKVSQNTTTQDIIDDFQYAKTLSEMYFNSKEFDDNAKKNFVEEEKENLFFHNLDVDALISRCNDEITMAKANLKMINPFTEEKQIPSKLICYKAEYRHFAGKKKNYDSYGLPDSRFLNENSCFFIERGKDFSMPENIPYMLKILLENILNKLNYFENE